MQAIDGNNTTPPLRDQPHNNNPNTMNLRQNQAYGTQPKETSHDSNTDREYEVIPPLAQEIVTNDDSRVQGNQTVTGTQPHQPMSPGQPNEEIEHSRMHPGQEMTEGDEHKDSTGNENVYTLEPKAEDDEDKMAAPYEIPVPTKIKK